MTEYLSEGQVFLINKPYGWTSFDVVNKMRTFVKRKLGMPKLKIGHAGTLDPLATGLLIICTGKFTKRIEEFQNFEKEYTGTFYVGKTTPSYDLEKQPDTDYPTSHISPEMLTKAVDHFTGIQQQIPPVFSAVKVDGKRLFSYARSNKDVIIKSREITIHHFELTRVEIPLVDFKVVCSKGTYIRSLARDFGEFLNSGAYLQNLCRTRIGDFSLSTAYSLEDWEFEQRKINAGSIE
ncbi:MAG: tRNA pseudouridine(55) synthase TruB [Bacteroidales bacterium]